MKTVLLAFTTLFLINPILAGEADPNNYFKNRTWNLKWEKHKLKAKSVYDSEPISQPNRLNVDLICKGTKKRIPVVEDLKYCGLQSISVLGDRVIIYLSDYDPNDPRGYCNLRRKEPEQYNIPKECKSSRKNSKSKKKFRSKKSS